jgi:propanol-preferring alcohol dehydrogenase
MKAWLLTKSVNLRNMNSPLELKEVDKPEPRDHEVLIRVHVCGICHTELDEIEGRLMPSRMPMIPGHQVVGHVEASGKGVSQFKTGDRVGVGWIFSACGACDHCHRGDENLCSEFIATGRDRPGGYAEWMTVPESYAFPIPGLFKDDEAAPLLCAGAIGYRSLRLTGLTDGQCLGLTGFGASGHLIMKTARYCFPKSDIIVFARSEIERRFAVDLGAVWAGDTTDTPPRLCDAIIDTTPVWKPVAEALRVLRPGGRLVINAIRKESADQSVLMNLDYTSQLWMEKEIKTVANVAGRDIREFLEIASKIPIRPEVQVYPFYAVNEALIDLKGGRIRGAKVLKVIQS